MALYIYKLQLYPFTSMQEILFSFFPHIKLMLPSFPR